ncbi:MAG: RNA polymerase factor sigma-54 [Planctomycetes bacterium]|nr:RNA polymerase factor sigma-54 [Planctomycetota bacterium]
MRMEATLQPRLEQRMKLAPQIIQSIEILQLPTLALQERVQQELEENPVLELKQEAEEPEKEGEAEPETPAEDHEGEDPEYEKIENMADDWRDYFSQTSERRRSSDEGDEKLEALQNTAARPITLQDYLVGQLSMLEMPENVRETAEFIVHNLDNNGYLLAPLDELVTSMDNPVPMTLAEEALKAVQSLEPRGVGARDLKECLMLQLSEKDPHYALAKALIVNHLEDIEQNRFPAIVSKTGQSLDAIKEAVEFIKALHPKPGVLFGEEPSPYVVPDVIVQEMDDKYEVIVEERNLPSLYISPYYRQLLSQEKAGSPAREFIQKKIESARWLIDAIEQRRNTLYKVACKIVEIQKDFMEHGISRLKPLKMQEVADEVGMHVSTVSRAIARKYVQTPQGVYDLKYFFTGGTTSAEGDEVSWGHIKQKLLGIVQNEDKSKPLSDDEIAAKFKEQGLDVARRTVTKYRQALKIPSSRRRRQY